MGRPSRGLTAAIIDDTRRLTRYQVGDAIVGTGPLGGSLQLGGVAVSRDFSLDPYFIRYPTTGLAGVVTTPSRVDLYVNNQLVRSVQLPPGAYQLANLALPTGAADTRVVVRDAFGGQQEFGGSYDVTTSILSRGLQHFSTPLAPSGCARSTRCGTTAGPCSPAPTGSASPTLSRSADGSRWSRGSVSTGPTLATRLGRFGALELTSGASHAGGRGGLAGGIAYEYIGRPGCLSLAWRETSEGYENLTSRRMLLGMRREVLASTTARLTSHVTLSAGWQAQDADVAEPQSAAPACRPRSRWPRVSLFVSATRSRLDVLWSNGAFAAMSLNLGPRTTASVTAESSAGRTAVGMNLQQSAPVGPGFGYRAAGQRSGRRRRPDRRRAGAQTTGDRWMCASPSSTARARPGRRSTAPWSPSAAA